MERKVLLSLLLRVSLTSATLAESVKDRLEQQYKKHVLALRSPLASGTDQEFDSNGQPLSLPQGKWLLYGGIFVEKISLSPKNLRFEGRRIAFGQDKNNHPVGFTLGKSVRVEIQLDQPLTSFDQAHALIERVFFPQSESMEHP